MQQAVYCYARYAFGLLQETGGAYLKDWTIRG